MISPPAAMEKSRSNRCRSVAPRACSGFAFNTRRAMFRDPRLREALATMFDFEWLNADLFSNLYTRDKSFFDESELSALGRPASAAERKLLAPFPGAVREDVMNGTWAPPRSDGTGRDRELARKALALARQAGWRIENGRLARDGRPLQFEILVEDREQERLALIFPDLLRRIGVEARVRLVDEAQYQGRRQRFDFDMTIGLWQASASPGNEQRMRWGGDSADQEASYNFAGARSPAIDAMIAALQAARGRGEFVTAARALDRVLLSGFYVVPLYHSPAQWIAYWRRIGHPTALPRYAQPLFGDVLETWSENRRSRSGCGACPALSAAMKERGGSPASQSRRGSRSGPVSAFLCRPARTRWPAAFSARKAAAKVQAAKQAATPRAKDWRISGRAESWSSGASSPGEGSSPCDSGPSLRPNA